MPPHDPLIGSFLRINPTAKPKKESPIIEKVAKKVFI